MTILRTTAPSKVPGYKNLLAFIDESLSNVPVGDITETLILAKVLQKLDACEGLLAAINLARVSHEIDNNGHVVKQCLLKAKALARNSDELKLLFNAASDINYDRLFNENPVISLKPDSYA